MNSYREILESIIDMCEHNQDVDWTQTDVSKEFKGIIEYINIRMSKVKPSGVKKYTVEFQCTLWRTFTVLAESEEQAVELAEIELENCEYASHAFKKNAEFSSIRLGGAE